jgi:cold shock protein
MALVFHLHAPAGLLWHSLAYASPVPAGLRKNLASGGAGRRFLACRSLRSPLYYCNRFLRGSAVVASGTVKWFNNQKGYGFIAPDSGGKDVFVHISAVEKAGFSSLVEGAKVSYDIISDRGKESVGNLQVK